MTDISVLLLHTYTWNGLTVWKQMTNVPVLHSKWLLFEFHCYIAVF